MSELKIEYVELSTLKPYENNAKIHTEEQIAQICESIVQFGMNDPIAVWHDNEIIEGHGRLLACKRLGMKTVPVIRLDDLTDEERRAYMNAHNQLTMNTGFDIELLNAELAKIENIDMSKFGFDVNMTADDDEVEEDDYIEPEDLPARTRMGDMYRLGDHILMCGDSTTDDVQKLCGGGTVDLCVTDPPYNVSVESAAGLTIKNDNMAEKEFSKFLISAFQQIEKALRPGAAFYIWYASLNEATFVRSLNEATLRFKEQLIWVKSQHSLGRSDYQWRHEPCLYGWKEGAAHYFINSRTESTVIDDTPDIDRMTKQEMADLLRAIYQTTPTTAIYEKKPAVAVLHPTMKPVALIAYQVANSSRRGETVLDPFGGSGTTLIACEQLGRKCLMMEYDPHYCDVIIDRWEQFTGKKAVLIDG